MIRLRKFTDIFSLWCIEGHAWGRVSIQLEKLYLPNKPNRNLYLVYWQKSLLLYIINIEWRIYWVSVCSFRKQFTFFLSSAELWKLWWCSVFMCSLCLNSEQFLKIVYITTHSAYAICFTHSYNKKKDATKRIYVMLLISIGPRLWLFRDNAELEPTLT